MVLRQRHQGLMNREDEIRSSSAQGWNTSMSVGQIANHNTAEKTLERNPFSARGTLRYLETVQDAKCRWNRHTKLTRKGKEARTFGV